MKKNLNINVSSGNASFGAVSQGNHNTVAGEANIDDGMCEKSWAAFLEQSAAAAEAADVDTKELEELRAAVEDLKTQVSKEGWVERTGTYLKMLYKAYGWAAAPIKSLFGLA